MAELLFFGCSLHLFYYFYSVLCACPAFTGYVIVMDKYTILLRIGEGAHGVVYKAKHIESGEVVALKKVFSTVFIVYMKFVELLSVRSV